MYRVLLPAALALTVSAAINQAAAPTFAPFEQWKKAVVSGDEATLESLYSRQPPAHVLQDRTELPGVETECKFWTTLKNYGVSDVNPKLLSIKDANGQAQLVLRIDARTSDKKIVASMVQVWVQQLDGWHLAVTQRSRFGLEATRRLPEPVKPNAALYAPPAEARADLRAASTTAKREHKRVLVVFGANWCYDCHVLDTTFHSPGFATLVNRNYVVVHINIGDDGKDNNDLARQFGVALDRGVPNLAVLDADGKVLVAQQGEFEATTKIGPNDVRAFLEKWKPEEPAKRRTRHA